MSVLFAEGFGQTRLPNSHLRRPPAPISKLVFEVAVADGDLSNLIRPLVKNAHAVFGCSSNIEIGDAGGRGAATNTFHYLVLPSPFYI